MDNKETQEELESRLGLQIAENPNAKNVALAYDEFHNYILKNGVRGASVQGYIYKKKLSLFDKGLLKLIGKNKKVLDIGCGEGTLALGCAKNNDVIGLDISLVAIKLAESRKGDLKVHFEIGEAQRLCFPDNYFDIIICKDVIEHLPANELIFHLKEVKRVLRKDGTYILFTPSKLLGDLSLGLHLKEYGLGDLIPILRQNDQKVGIICLLPLLFGFPARISSPILISATLRYERLLAKTGLGRRLAKLGIVAYGIVPVVLIAAKN